MRLETKFVRNYLSKNRFHNGSYAVVITLGLCLLASWLYWNKALDISKYISASRVSVFENREYWRLFTTSFVHADLKHLLSNSLMLSILVYFMTSFYGALISVVLSFIVAILTNYLVIDMHGGAITLVGASGVVFYLWGFWMTLYIYLQRHQSIKGRLLRMGAVFMILLIPNEYQPSTSYLAHYIGFAFGVIAGLIYYLINKSNLLKAEVWETLKISEEYSELDEIALNFSVEEEDEL